MKFVSILLSIFEFIINPFQVLLNIDIPNKESKHKVLPIILWIILSIAIALCVVYGIHKYIEAK